MVPLKLKRLAMPSEGRFSPSVDQLMRLPASSTSAILTSEFVEIVRVGSGVIIQVESWSVFPISMVVCHVPTLMGSHASRARETIAIANGLINCCRILL